MTGAGEAAEFATRSTARGARTIMARKLGTGVLLAVTLRLYFRSRSTARAARTIMGGNSALAFYYRWRSGSISSAVSLGLEFIHPDPAHYGSLLRLQRRAGVQATG